MSVTEVDGRRLRRQTNRESVLHALVALLEDGVYQPTAQDIADRAGISLRSLFRYFDDVDDLSRAAIEAHMERNGQLFDLVVDAAAATPEKIAAVVEQRARLFDVIAPTARTARATAHRNDVIASQLGRIRSHLRDDLKRVFARELKAAPAETLPALDVLCSFESYELLRYDQGLARPKTLAVLTAALTALLGR